MRKLFFALMATGLVSATTHAQTSFGIKGGLNIASVSNLGSSSSTVGTTSATSNSKPQFGANFGAYANIAFSDLLGFQPEFLFSMKGYKYESDSKVGNIENKVTANVHLNYLEIPLQLRINPAESFYLLGGPYLGFLLGASNTSTSYSSVPPVPPVTTTSKSTSTNGLNGLDLGISLGAGIQMKSGFTAGLKYLRGFNSIIKDDNNSANVNSAFQFFVGFSFGK